MIIRNEDAAISRVAELLNKINNYGHSYETIYYWLKKTCCELMEPEKQSGDFIASMGIKVTRYIYEDEDYLEINLNLLEIDKSNSEENFNYFWPEKLEKVLGNI